MACEWASGTFTCMLANILNPDFYHCGMGISGHDTGEFDGFRAKKIVTSPGQGARWVET